MASIAMLGSGEFEPWSDPVERWCVGRAPGSRVLVVPTASAPEGDAAFARWATMGLSHYRRLGLEPVLLDVRTRDDAAKPDVVDAVAGAGTIFFSGGNPGYLADTLRDTPLWGAIVAAVAGGTALGGCSAGAVFLGTRAPFVANDSLSHWVPGLSLLGRAYIAPHFDVLDSYGPDLRAMFVRECPPGSIVVGIDENTALYGDGERWTVHGAGAAWIAVEPDPGALRPYRAGEELSLSLGLAVP